MYRIFHGVTHDLDDVNRFIDVINSLERNSSAEARELFDSDKEILVTRAPGRLDVMGGIADYSGSLVLQLPLREATFAAIQLAADRKLRIVSLSSNSADRTRRFEMDLHDFEKIAATNDYLVAQNYFRVEGSTTWAAYAAGTFAVLMKERNVQFPCGARILIYSEVPEGKGVSSSAAIEVAVMAAVASAFKIKITPKELAALCQIVENKVVGAPCGIMDQMTAACGKAGQLLQLICQPADLREPLPIPDNIAFWGIDSGITHSVSGSDYTSVRVGAFMGYRLIAEQAGLAVSPRKNKQQVSIDDPNWRGYLANISPSIYERNYAPNLPDTIAGKLFLQRYHGTTDEVTTVDPDVVYPVAKPTAHPIYEDFRVRTFAELLQGSGNERTLLQLGELMYQSHNSYSACGLGVDGTDRLVELAREAGIEKGIYGAKITGGGSGGTVAILGRADAFHSVETIAEKYGVETGTAPYIFTGSSMGANNFGNLILRKG
jgi:L-arabinokinase